VDDCLTRDLLPTYDEIIDYVYDQFKLSYCAPALSPKDLKELCSVRPDGVALLSKASLWVPNSILLYKLYQVPVFFTEGPVDSLINEDTVQFDVYLNAFLFLSGLQERACLTKDKFGRFPYQESLQCKYGFVDTPVVNVYFELLAEAIKAKGHDCIKVEFEQKIIFTHDIDQIRSGWLTDVRYYVSNFNFKNCLGIFKSIGIKVFRFPDPYYKGLLKMLELDEQNEVKGVSFLMANKKHQDADYQLESLVGRELFQNQTIGLHPGLDTYDNPKEFDNQLKKIKKLFPKMKPVVRQHFLKYDINVTPAIQESLGIEKDYSLGFVEQKGFRNGIANPFYLYCFEKRRAYKVLQIPLYFMDGTLTNHQHDFSFRAKKNVIQDVEKLVRTFNCSFSVLFHNSVFTETTYRGFEEMYLKLIAISKS
jgi:hypothetical protein